MGQIVTQIAQRADRDGGFRCRPDGPVRPEDTAWAVMALAGLSGFGAKVAAGRDYLSNIQAADGRVSAEADHPEAAWVTPLAILAWRGSADHDRSLEPALHFLLNYEGQHWVNKNPEMIGHDTSLPGWPWIQGTHSWVMPTALGLLALKALGRADHPRAEQAVRLLMNRRLPMGGWNYGNTKVFGQVLPPMPEMTGAALTALAGLVPWTQTGAGLDYLSGQAAGLNTPQALGWGLIAQTAWNQNPKQAEAMVQRVLARQERLGPFDTASLALLTLALRWEEAGV